MNVQCCASGVQRVAEHLPSLDSEVVCLQEDLNRISWEEASLGRYRVASRALAEKLPKLDDFGREKFLCNTILIRRDSLGELGRTGATDATENGKVPRSAAFAEFRGFLIGNLHLSGGRYDDPEFRSSPGVKARQVFRVARYALQTFGRLPDIVAGDFNGERDPKESVLTLQTYPLFRRLNSIDQSAFLEWYSAAHVAMKLFAYEPAYEEGEVRPTSVYGGVPDWVYVRRSSRVLLSPKSPERSFGFDPKSSVSDHASITVFFENRARES